MEYAECCRDCVLNHDCLLQENSDVEECEDYKKWEMEELSKNRDKP